MICSIIQKWLTEKARLFAVPSYKRNPRPSTNRSRRADAPMGELAYGGAQRRPQPVWGGHSRPLLLTSGLELLWANWPARSDSDAAGQFVGKRAGSARAVVQEGAKRRPQPVWGGHSRPLLLTS